MAATNLLKVTALKNFMKGTLNSSFRTAPSIKPSTSKTATEQSSCFITISKGRLTDHFVVPLNHRNMFPSLKNKLTIIFLSNFAR